MATKKTTTEKKSVETTKETTTPRTRKPKTSAAKTTKATEVVSVAPAAETKTAAPTYQSKKSNLGVQVRNSDQIPLDALITVRNLTAGRLIYSGRHMSGYTIPWESYGETREIEMRELYNMKNTDSLFFKENWVEVDQQVLENLHVDQYYKNAITYSDIEDMPYGSVDVIREKFSSASDVIRYSVISRARQFVESGEITDIRLIQDLESIFGCKLLTND